MGIYSSLQRNETLFLTNKIAKIYPDHVKVIEYKKSFLGTIPDLEGINRRVYDSSENPPETSEERAIRRTKTTISDLVLCNDFDLFTTFTFNKDRQDIVLCKQKMSRWLHSQQKKYGKFKYIIVPEFHKDGKSIHFHALLKDYKGTLKEAKNKKTNKAILHSGRQVYNIQSYQSGFSTAIKIDNKQKVSSYIKKYITKDMPSIKNKQRFWTSQHLIRPEKILLPSQVQQITTNPFLTSITLYKNNKYTIKQYNVTIKMPTNNKESEKWLNKKKQQRNNTKTLLKYQQSSFLAKTNMVYGMESISKSLLTYRK